ncbi:MAG: DUF1211 domain-containing protein [Methanosphaera sp.]|nr:DUF1211 domain-containing protein [Methanosphaera sp.]
MDSVNIESNDEKEIKEMLEDITEKLDYIKEKDKHKNKKRYKKLLNDLNEIKNDDNPNIEDLNRINQKLNYYERIINALEIDIDIDPGRLLGLTDGIFGMVMTLLIFGVSLPEIEITNYTNFITFITNLIPTIGITIISFVLLASFWIYHHEFIKIKKLNIPYLWINMLFLLSISFIPFTTSIIGNYSHFFLSEAIFGLNVFIVLASFTYLYNYAYSRNFLENEPSDQERKYVLETFLITMILTIIINLLDYNVSPRCIYLFLLIPVITTIRDVIYKINLQKNS